MNARTLKAAAVLCLATLIGCPPFSNDVSGKPPQSALEKQKREPVHGFGNIDVKDASGTTRTYQTTVVAGVHTGHQIIDSSALPSGAATAAKQPALGTAGSPSADVITVQGVTSMTALKTDGSAVTQPVSAASLPLPSGAATAAKQPALGTAGSASADVISIQGVASMTAVKTDGSGVTQPVSGTVTSGQGTAASASGAWPIKVSDGTDTVGISTVSGSKALKVDVVQSVSGGSGGTSLTDNAAFTPGSTSTTPVSAEVDDTGTSAATENSAAALRMSTRRELYNQIRDAAGNERGANVTSANALKVDNSAVTQPVSGTVTAVGGAASGAAVSGNPVLTAGSDGTNARTLKVDSSGYLGVNIISGAGSGGTALADDAAFTPTTTSVTPVGAEVDDTGTTAATENHAASLRMSTRRELYGQIRDAAGNERGANVTSSNALKVDNSGVTQPVSGTVTANIGTSGSLALDATLSGNLKVVGPGASGAALSGNPVRVAGSDGTNAVDMKVDSSGRPVVVGAGTAGSAAGGVLSIQGVASMTAVKVDGSAVTQPISASSLPLPTSASVAATDDAAYTPATDKANVIAAEVDDTSPDSVDEGDVAALRASSRRELYTQIRDAAGNERGVNVTSGNALKVDGSAVTQPVSGTVTANIGTSGSLALDATLSGNLKVVGPGASGSATSGNPVRVAGSDGTNTRDLKTDSSGDAVVVGAGTAGSASGGVVTIQGVASMTAVKVDGSAVTQPVSLTTISSSVVPGTSATHLGKAEDAAHTDADTGVFMLSVRKDSVASTAGTTGDYAAVTTDANGLTWVRMRPDIVAATTTLNGLASNATQTGSAIDVTYYRTVCFSWTITSASTPIGTFEIDSSYDGTNNWEPIYIDANKLNYDINGTVQTWNGGSTQAISSPAGTVTSNACVEATLPFVRIKYARTSGGTTGSQITANYTLRSN